MSHKKTGNNQYGRLLAKQVRMVGRLWYSNATIRDSVTGKEVRVQVITKRKPSDIVDRKFAI